MPKRPRRRVLLLGLLAAAASAFVFVRWWEHYEPPGVPQLLLGADASVSGPVTVKIVPPIELDGMSRAEVIALRRDAAARDSQLFVPDYAPSQEVYGTIADRARWWGMEGQYLHGAGDHSPDGPSEEARFLLNPLLLVGGTFPGLSIWSRRFRWRPEVGRASFEAAGVELHPSPRDLTVWPKQRRAEVTYDVSAWLQAAAPLIEGTVSAKRSDFELAPINARALGFRYAAIDLERTSNLEPRTSEDPIQLQHYIHLGRSCRAFGGCNNGSPRTPELDSIEMLGLPAEIAVRLWFGEPGSITDDPDFLFTVHLR